MLVTETVTCQQSRVTDLGSSRTVTDSVTIGGMAEDEQISVGAALRRARQAAGLSMQKLADLSGTKKQTVEKLEKGEMELTRTWAERFAPHLDVSAKNILFPEGGEATAPILGLVGADAGADVVLFNHGQGNLGRALLPPGGTESTVALEVRGESMRGMADDGWLVYYDDPREPPTSELIGEPCVCWLEDDRVLIKRLYYGRGEGLFDLESMSVPNTMRDVPVRRAALVTAIVPRIQARRMIRRGEAEVGMDVPHTAAE